ncbi:MAG: tRNA (adenosine(37)-N6)-dimethylallyltransferase MiaA, partial [Candidatus Uhrbacteria bacterium]|nr:tRNA (adenosine(37)-N6)-dimethylallyltransferase MiaA [Candidatus Uhrbacteria bacterium]
MIYLLTSVTILAYSAMMKKPKIIVLVGPTASGKSDLAVRLAKKYGGEVISADSRQVYRGLDIGTGKITKKEMRGIRHHLLDVASAKRVFTVENFQKLGAHEITDIGKRGKLPMICGGTGFYISALVDGLVLPEVSPNFSLRKKLAKKSTEQLFALLKKLDPRRARTIDHRNPRRLIRAIEIATALGKVPRVSRRQAYDPLFIGISVSKEELRGRIHKRLLARMGQGMVTEAKQLHQKGVSWKRMEEFGLEYRYLARYLQ